MELVINQPGPVIEVPQTDLVIGAVTGYNWSQIEPWAISLEKSGYTGKKAVIAYDMDTETVQELTKHQFSIMAFKHNEETKAFETILAHPSHIVTWRFLHLWMLLHGVPEDQFNQFRYIIATDVKDVVFQSNPSTFLENNLYPRKIVVGSEGLLYKNEPWGCQNMKDSFGEILSHYMADKPIYNAGTIAGEAYYMRDLFLQIWMYCQTNPLHNPDQAALNVILSTKPWSDITWKATNADGWCCQAGTMADPSKMEAFRLNLLEEQPYMDGGYVFPKDSSNRYCLLHQYDRNPVWKEIIETKYREVK